MKINEKICGFIVTEVREVPQLKAEAVYMTHEKTDAKLLWLNSAEENKTFSIAFRTIPDDSTGVFHILEHSVLNGSDRYPVKEPFVDLLKSSLNTFLNAITFPDKTVYPVSSRNSQDFINLMRVYLDAVFHPLAVKQPYTFYQEGWHYELTDEEGTPSIKGVVYNEMQGSFANAENYCGELLMQQLFPDSGYGYCSGGDPEVIPTLTYEKFCAQHQKHYHPTNSLIYLDGKMDIEKVLGIINDEYLSHYEKNEEIITIDWQKPVIRETLEKQYELPASFPTENRTMMNFGYVTGSWENIEENIALSLIANHLAGNNQSPLTKAILSLELAEDVSVYLEDSIMQPYMSIFIQNTDRDKYQIIKDIINTTLESLVKNGLDHKEIAAGINKLEFRDKERDFGYAPKGILYDISALSTWLYGGDPMDGIEHSYVFDSLRKKLNEGYFEQLINDKLLHCNHRAEVILTPSSELGQIKAEKMNQQMNSLKEKLSTEEKKALVETNRILSEKQNSEDSKEASATIPLLTLADIFDKPQKLDYDKSEVEDTDVIFHHVETNGINYLHSYFSINDFNEKQLSQASLLALLLNDIDTEKYQVLQLNQMIQAYLGKLSFTPGSSYNPKTRQYNIHFAMSASFLNQFSLQAYEVIKEVMFKTLFNDRKNIEDIIAQNVTTLQQSFVTRGNAMGMRRIAASDSIGGLADECFNGYIFYNYLKNFDYEKEIEELKQLYQNIFVKERMTVSVNEAFDEKFLNSFIKMFPQTDFKAVRAELKPLGRRKEAIVISGAVGYAEMGGNIFEQFRNVRGNMLVASRILTYDYLWNEVRVKGGAYGTGFSVKANGQLAFYSYRDPSPVKSMDIYRKASQHLRDFCDSDQPLSKYIIGTIGDSEPLLTNSTRISAADAEYFCDMSYDEKCQFKAQILSTTKADLLRLCDMIDEICDIDNYCVVAGKNVIEENRDLFDSIIEL